MSQNKRVWASLTASLVILVTLLAACNFPLFSANSTADLQATQNSLELTVNALTTGDLQSTTEGEAAVTASEPVAVEATITSTQAIVHLVTPINPSGGRESWMVDANSSANANNRKVSAGENFAYNFYERPFNSDPMDQYFADLDILEGILNRQDVWVFIKIRLQGLSPDGTLRGSYGAEFDLNVDGRGDVLVFVHKPGAEWSVEGVQVWKDNNNNVGGRVPIEGDNPPTGDGYETVLFNAGEGSDPDAAWAKVDPADPKNVYLAFKYGLINNDPAFTWGAWSKTEFQPGWFDYNDYYTLMEAGSPLTYQSAAYPLKAFSEVDNTCRWPLGFTATGHEPGVCPIPVTPTPTATVTPTPRPGTVTGIAWWDGNNDRVIQPTEFKIPGVPVQIQRGSCSSPGEVVGTATTNAAGAYAFSGLKAESYCVGVSGVHGYGPIGGTTPLTVSVSPGGTSNANFPFFVIIY